MPDPDEPTRVPEPPPIVEPTQDWSRPRQPQAPASSPATPIDHLIPAKNPAALTGYYIGVFSLIPCVGLVLGPLAVMFGTKGLKAVASNPELPGKGHAWTAIVLGGLTTLGNIAVAVWMVLLGLSGRS